MPTLIIFKGMPGTGKSTLADQLHTVLGWEIVVRDNIKEALLKEGIAPNELGKLSYSRMWDTLTQRLANGYSVIGDTNINQPAAVPKLNEIVRETQARIMVIECVCSDENQHRRRLDLRKDQHMATFWIDSWDKFQSYLKSDDNQRQYSLPYPVIEVDTCSDFSLEAIVGAIAGDVGLS